MNSSLQCFTHCTSFCKRLHSILDNNLNDKELSKKFKKILSDIDKGIDQIDSSGIKIILSKAEKKYIGNEQNDANEFITIFLNTLLKELKGIGEYKRINYIGEDVLGIQAFLKLENRFFDKNQSFLLDLFYGRLKRDYICAENTDHIIAVKFDNFSTLILPQPNKYYDIIHLLNQYQEGQPINGTIYCNKCNKDVKYSIRTSIYNIPNYFIICLEQENKYNSKILEYPLELSIKDFMNKDFIKQNEQYFLKSLICYTGNRESGHYIAKCYNECDEKWYEINDSYYYEIHSDEVVDSNAIILFYEKIGNNI